MLEDAIITGNKTFLTAFFMISLERIHSRNFKHDIIRFRQLAIVTQESVMWPSKIFRNLSFQFCACMLYFIKNKKRSVLNSI